MAGLDDEVGNVALSDARDPFAPQPPRWLPDGTGLLALGQRVRPRLGRALRRSRGSAARASCSTASARWPPSAPSRDGRRIACALSNPDAPVRDLRRRRTASERQLTQRQRRTGSSRVDAVAGRAVQRHQHRRPDRPRLADQAARLQRARRSGRWCSKSTAGPKRCTRGASSTSSSCWPRAATRCCTPTRAAARATAKRWTRASSPIGATRTPPTAWPPSTTPPRCRGSTRRAWASPAARTAAS